MRLSAILLIAFLSFSSTSFGRNVMTWIPAYGIDDAKTAMTTNPRAQWFKDGLTHIGMQFWVPGNNGSVVFVTNYQYTWKAATISQDVQDIAAWGNTNNVKTFLCLYNARAGGFDWNLTKQVITTYPAQTVDTLVKLVNHYGLDGVDIDFEGTDDYNSDKTAFVSFLNLLGTALHATGKELSVDMFSTPCYNSPNPSWESAMAPHVDFMNIMGYNETYEANNTVFSYCPMTPSETNSRALKYSYIENYLTTKQLVSSSKLNYGLPAWEDAWGGQCGAEHILDILDISSSGGIAIWDMNLSGGGFWTNPATWDLIKLFKNGYTSTQVRGQVPVCGILTAVTGATDTQQPEIYFDDENQLLHVSGKTGDVYLYTVTGALEQRWHNTAGEDISFVAVPPGLYLVKIESASGTLTKRISLFR